jgi:hypothetical protein
MWLIEEPFKPACKAVLWIRDILVLVQIQIPGSVSLINGSGSSFVVLELQDANKKLSFSVYYGIF